MGDELISRQAVIETIRAEREWLDENIKDVQHHFHTMNETTRILSIIGKLPSVQPKTGRWIYYDLDEYWGDWYKCSKCSECGGYKYSG